MRELVITAFLEESGEPLETDAKPLLDFEELLSSGLILSSAKRLRLVGGLHSRSPEAPSAAEILVAATPRSPDWIPSLSGGWSEAEDLLLLLLLRPRLSPNSVGGS